MIDIGPFLPGDRDAWEELARGYKAFYQDPMPDEAYEQTWRRLTAGTELLGLGARLDGRLAGLAHNATARLLYDQLARFTGFIRYGHPL
jgi:hypothetical protein